MVVIKLMTIMH